jgi:outer membrane protein assembly factor BamB
MPSVVVLDAADGSFCWSAVSDWNLNAVEVHDGLVVVAGETCADGQGGPGAVMALDVVSGRQRWKVDLSADGRPAHPVAAVTPPPSTADVIVVPSESGLAGLDVRSGAVLWSEQGEPALADGPEVVLAAASPTSHVMVALDRRTGKERWRTDVGSEIDLSVGNAVSADTTAVLVTTREANGPERTVAYDAHTGTKRWTASFGPGSDVPAVGIIDGVATGEDDGAPSANVRALDVATGRLMWSVAANPVQSPEPTDHNVYASSVADGAFMALDPRTGHTRWELAPLNESTVSAGPGLVLVQAGDHARAVDPQTGETRWQTTLAGPRFPVLGAPSANNFTISANGALPTSDGVFITYGNCLGN